MSILLHGAFLCIATTVGYSEGRVDNCKYRSSARFSQEISAFLRNGRKRQWRGTNCPMEALPPLFDNGISFRKVRVRSGRGLAGMADVKNELIFRQLFDY